MKNSINEVIKAAYFDRTKVKIEQPVITIQGRTIARPDNIICFAGLPKARKTTFVMGLVASCVTGETYFEMKAKQGKVVFIDTEQSQQDHLKMIEQTETMVGKALDHEQFISFTFRKFSVDEVLAAIEPILKKIKPNYLVLDALTELVYDANDMESAKKLIEFLKRITNEYNLVVIGVMHLGKTNNFTLGNLGSAVDRVSQSVLMVTKDEETETSILSAKFLRSDKHFNPIGIVYSEHEKTMVQTDIDNIKAGQPKKRWSDKTEVEHWNICEVIFTSQKVLKYKALVEALTTMYGRGSTVVKQQIVVFLISRGFIVNQNGDYILGSFINSKSK